MSVSSPTTFETLLYEKRDSIAYVTVNRPKVLNALSQRTWQDLRQAFEDAAGRCRKAEAIRKKTFSKAPRGWMYSLEAVNRGLERSQSEGLALEASLFGLSAGTDDKREGTAAFLEKRKAQFQAR